jgi:hypothetical protein
MPHSVSTSMKQFASMKQLMFFAVFLLATTAVFFSGGLQQRQP